MRTLKEIESGNTVKVIKLDGKGPVKRRIMDMGITKSENICRNLPGAQGAD